MEQILENQKSINTNESYSLAGHLSLVSNVISRMSRNANFYAGMSLFVSIAISSVLFLSSSSFNLAVTGIIVLKPAIFWSFWVLGLLLSFILIVISNWNLILKNQAKILDTHLKQKKYDLLNYEIFLGKSFSKLESFIKDTKLLEEYKLWLNYKPAFIFNVVGTKTRSLPILAVILINLVFFIVTIALYYTTKNQLGQ